MSKVLSTDNDYRGWLQELKLRIRQSQIKAAVRVNKTMLELYWSIGADIVARQAESVWGSGVLRKLSQDIRDDFPGMQGFSERNLKYMRQFYEYYSCHNSNGQQGIAHLDEDNRTIQCRAKSNRQQLVAQLRPENFPQVLGLIPWGHHIAIFTHCKSMEEAYFYVDETAKNGWSRAVLSNFMAAGLYGRQGKSANNFDRLLPEPQSDLAAEILKDPYQFDFIALADGYKEKELEDALTSNITKFLLELGQGFAYIGRQVPIVVGSQEFFIDLLFYHLELRCYIVIELKAGEFKPEYVGKLGFYLSAVNHQKKKDYDNQTVGLIICHTKDNVVAQYALESSTQPIGISEYELARLLPENYKSTLPSIEEIEAELQCP